MWRLANYIFRAFRNTAFHRCPQDIVVPLTTVCNKDDDSERIEEEKNSNNFKCDASHIIKNNQLLIQNIKKLQEHLQKISLQQLTYKANVIEATKDECIVKEIQSIPPPPVQTPSPKTETLDSLLQADEICMNTIKNLSELHEETMSIINNQLAIEALESGNLQLGIETLQASVKDGRNASALYNLGICYERGIGVEQDRAKACDYYRQASALGHINAQFNLTLLSNHIDINDNEDEKIEQTIINKPRSFRFSFAKEYKEEQSSWNDYQFNFTKTLAYLT